MKYKLIKICALCLVPALMVSFAGCDKTVAENSGYTLQDAEVTPTVTAPYEEESKAVIDEYYAVVSNYTGDSGTIDYSSDEVQAAAKTAVAQLYAYACYNEVYLDKYVYFSDQTGKTSLNSMGSSTATKQDYKLIIHESDTVCGYKYHYTIKNVDEATGFLNNSLMKSSFESCKLRFVEAGTNCLYRFNGDDVTYDDDGYLTCTWKKDTSQSGGWGSSEGEPAVVKRSGNKLTIDEIEEDIVAIASNNPSEAVIHGNVNVLADDMVSYALLTEADIGTSGKGYTAVMVINTAVANEDEASLLMLREANSSSNCEWSDGKLSIVFQIWDNGLFNYYYVSETWQGKISGFTGSAQSNTKVIYSYSDRDTDITEKLEMLDKAKAE